MTETLESLLAKLTGRSTWPSVKATVADHLLVRTGAGMIELEPPGDVTTDIFQYEVNGTVYTRPIGEISGDTPLATGAHVHIQYNPNRPSQCYYAPNNQLAGRAIVCAVIVGATIAIALSVHFHH